MEINKFINVSNTSNEEGGAIMRENLMGWCKKDITPEH